MIEKKSYLSNRFLFFLIDFVMYKILTTLLIQEIKGLKYYNIVLILHYAWIKDAKNCTDNDYLFNCIIKSLL